MKRIAIIHYGEIAIKGDNRIFFERKLITNIKRVLKKIKIDSVQRLRGRIVIFFSDIDSESMGDLLKNVFGITHFSFGVLVDKEMSEIKQKCWQLLENKDFDSFKIEASRSQKEFSLNSLQINQEVGAYIQAKSHKKVDLTNPDATVYIEITEKGALIYTEKIPGLRGLPVGVNEKAVSLLSSGIDSPVSSFLILKRGVQLIYAHFHSQPFTSKASQENAEKLIQKLNRYQLYAKAYFLPFIDIQKEIMAKAPSELRVLLYRRYMVRLSEKIARIEGAKALVTGESVGQVASQTISNIRVVGEVTKLPILRPLAGFDKEEIIQRAEAIGTYEISIQPYEDCCSLFVPDKPAIKGNPIVLAKVEYQLDIAELMNSALDKAEIKIFKSY